MIKEFKPTILFLVKFLGIYLVGNLIYGAWITHWHPLPDPMTRWVTEQSTEVLRIVGWDASAQDQLNKPTTFINHSGKAVVAVYEGCNGLNVMIVFLAFIIAFGPYIKTMSWFIPLGLAIIHISNLARITLLFNVSMKFPSFLYFTHKYLFTAFIYLFVLLLWMVWVTKIARRAPDKDGQVS